jgi:tellurite resistance protein TerB
MLTKFKEMMSQVASDGERLFSRVKDKTLFRRVVSASFLIARADGDFDSNEKSDLAKIIVKELPQFKIDDILSILSDCESKIAFDEAMGIQEIMHDVTAAKGDDAALIIRISCFIGASDGDFDANEMKVASDMAKGMDLDPSRYGL